jgi:hypothetical protein
MKIFRAIFVGLALSALLWVPSSSLAQYDKKPCGCTSQDSHDLDSRILQTEKAMRKLDEMIKEWSTGERATMTLSDGGVANDKGAEGFRGILMAELNFSMVGLPYARSYGAKTDAACDVIINPDATKCLRGALMDHEGVHAKVCKAKKKFNPFADFRDDQLVSDYLKEERAGYQAENERLKDEREKQKQCFLTDLDPSTKGALNAAFAQRDRNNDAANRLSGYGEALLK